MYNVHFVYIFCLFQSELQPWDSWDADDKQRNSANGRRFPHVNQRQTSQEEEPEPNYFEDMTPKIKKQKKVLSILKFNLIFNLRTLKIL